MEELKKTDRTTVTRLAKRASYDKEIIIAILKEGLVCQISFIHENQPFLLPHVYALRDDKIYIHGSVGSFMLRALKKEIELCFSVTLLDGLVLARSAFHHSVNYRSVVVFGKAKLVEDEQEKTEALKALTEHVVPGRWETVRPPNATELKQTMVLSIPLEEASAKIRAGGPIDDEEDSKLEVWAGVLPLKVAAGEPVPDEKHKSHVPTPSYLKRYSRSQW